MLQISLHLPILLLHNHFVADVDGCPLGVKATYANPILKEWLFVTSCKKQAVGLATLRCKHPKEFRHGAIAGGETKNIEEYPGPLCWIMLTSLV